MTNLRRVDWKILFSYWYAKGTGTSGQPRMGSKGSELSGRNDGKPINRNIHIRRARGT
jgi:hypothetical protein